jgi:hypothetical protein
MRSPSASTNGRPAEINALSAAPTSSPNNTPSKRCATKLNTRRLATGRLMYLLVDWCQRRRDKVVRQSRAPKWEGRQLEAMYRDHGSRNTAIAETMNVHTISASASNARSAIDLTLSTFQQHLPRIRGRAQADRCNYLCAGHS